MGVAFPNVLPAFVIVAGAFVMDSRDGRKPKIWAIVHPPTNTLVYLSVADDR